MNKRKQTKPTERQSGRLARKTQSRGAGLSVTRFTTSNTSDPETQKRLGRILELMGTDSLAAHSEQEFLEDLSTLERLLEKEGLENFKKHAKLYHDQQDWWASM